MSPTVVNFRTRRLLIHRGDVFKFLVCSLLAISKIQILKVAQSSEKHTTDSKHWCEVSLSIAIDMKHLDSLTCRCINLLDLGTMYVDNGHKCSHSCTLQFLLRVSCDPSLVATAHACTLAVKNKCDSSYYYVYNYMQSIDFAFCGNRKQRNAISVDCINYIIRKFGYTSILITQQRGYLHCNVICCTY